MILLADLGKLKRRNSTRMSMPSFLFDGSILLQKCSGVKQLVFDIGSGSGAMVFGLLSCCLQIVWGLGLGGERWGKA